MEQTNFTTRVQQLEDKSFQIYNEVSKEIILGLLNNKTIGLVRLKNGGSIFVQVKDGAIDDLGRDLSIEIPSLDILKTKESILRFIEENSDRQIEEIEMH